MPHGVSRIGRPGGLKVRKRAKRPSKLKATSEMLNVLKRGLRPKSKRRGKKSR